uniref:Truncated non-structural protein of 4.9 kDa n=1 Tax=Heterorhabditis bacteriophora TaxID=37862 RepID=A0A1I7WZM6_HETBA
MTQGLFVCFSVTITTLVSNHY